MAKLRNKMANLENELRGTKRKLAEGHTGDGKGKGKSSKGKGSGRGGRSDRSRIPESLRNKKAKTSNDEPICYNYNLPCGCSEAAPGERCRRGWHVCAEPGCHATHSILKH